MNKKILWIANADARGHLFRAYLAQKLFRKYEIDIHILTTNWEGKKFLNTIGASSSILPGNYKLCYDKRQNLDPRMTAFRIYLYIFFGCAALDLLFIKKRSEDYDLIINDLHPVLLFASYMVDIDVVHVYGENLWESVESHFYGIAPEAFARFFQENLTRLKNQARGKIVHTLSPKKNIGDTFYLPPLVDFVPRKNKINRVFIYLNPYFKDPMIAEALEKAMADLGLSYLAIGENYLYRNNWSAYSNQFSESLAESSLVISAPGMNLLSQVIYHRIPYLAILTNQPEQKKNLNGLKEIYPESFREIYINHETCINQLTIQLTSKVKELLEINLPDRQVNRFSLESSEELWVNTIEYFLKNRRRK